MSNKKDLAHYANFSENTAVYSQAAKTLGVLFCLLSIGGWIWQMFNDPTIQADAPSLTVNVHFTLQRLDVYWQRR